MVTFLLDLQDAVARNLLLADSTIISARVLALNSSNGLLNSCSWWVRTGLEGPRKLMEGIPKIGSLPDSSYPW